MCRMWRDEKHSQKERTIVYRCKYLYKPTKIQNHKKNPSTDGESKRIPNGLAVLHKDGAADAATGRISFAEGWKQSPSEEPNFPVPTIHGSIRGDKGEGKDNRQEEAKPCGGFQALSNPPPQQHDHREKANIQRAFGWFVRWVKINTFQVTGIVPSHQGLLNNPKSFKEQLCTMQAKDIFEDESNSCPYPIIDNIQESRGKEMLESSLLGYSRTILCYQWKG